MYRIIGKPHSAELGGIPVVTTGLGKTASEVAMDLRNIPFGTTTWAQIAPIEHRGETGVAYWHTQQFDDVRVRLVEYSPGYLADHWC
ncbi:MAG TPA: DHCW motif cupin fold protein, partial [Anaerolineae bacterium]|nr:DHCW motif cupin fold protein [Anaerolineae bacterium]